MAAILNSSPFSEQLAQLAVLTDVSDTLYSLSSHATYTSLYVGAAIYLLWYAFILLDYLTLRYGLQDEQEDEAQQQSQWSTVNKSQWFSTPTNKPLSLTSTKTNGAESEWDIVNSTLLACTDTDSGSGMAERETITSNSNTGLSSTSKLIEKKRPSVDRTSEASTADSSTVQQFDAEDELESSTAASPATKAIDQSQKQDNEHTASNSQSWPNLISSSLTNNKEFNNNRTNTIQLQTSTNLNPNISNECQDINKSVTENNYESRFPYLDHPLYDLCTTKLRPRKWFTVQDDIQNRLSLTIYCFYYCFFKHRSKFFNFSVKHARTWFNSENNLQQTLVPAQLGIYIFFPILPVFITFYVVFSRVKQLFQSNWTSNSIFFVRPPTKLGSFLWDIYMEMSIFMTNFLCNGCDLEGIQHSWHDVKTTKDYWRGLFRSGGIKYPRSVGRWCGGEDGCGYQKHIEEDLGDVKCDVITKIPDSFLGIGDNFFAYGKDYETEEELKQKLWESYQGKDALVLEFIKPRKGMEIHWLDILTMRNAEGEVKLISALYWGGCTDNTTHSCQTGYVIDAQTGDLVRSLNFLYAYYRDLELPPPKSDQRKKLEQSLNLDKPEVKQQFVLACQQAVRCHENVENEELGVGCGSLPWLNVIGWDCMITDDGPCFFEGNLGIPRTSRRMFLSKENVDQFLNQWPRRQNLGVAVMWTDY